MVTINDNNPEKKLTGTLICECSSCGELIRYPMKEKDMREYLDRKTNNRPMRPLSSVFPDIPQWILTGAMDPMAGDKTICPECEAKRR